MFMYVYISGWCNKVEPQMPEAASGRQKVVRQGRHHAGAVTTPTGTAEGSVWGQVNSCGVPQRVTTGQEWPEQSHHQ